ncbi:MAG: hypothetical protein DDT20_01824 [Firmicutes bacterium]|nr:hypothetical protein [Bacillota bacterium]
MARQARQESSTEYYHVMLRGINRDFLFEQDKDKHIFLGLLSEQQSEKLIDLAGWCIMGNHVHMLVKAERLALSRTIKIITLKFAARYNRRHQRIGPVFGDRFRSECIEDDAHLLGALRYIHLNPVKAKIVKSAAAYEWSSYGEYCNGAQFISEEQRAFVLALFGGNLTSYAEFHALPDSTEHLEIPEDLEMLRRERAAQLLEDFCREKGIERRQHLLSNPEFFADIVMRLTQGAGLSLRQAAELLETSHRRVWQAMQDDE